MDRLQLMKDYLDSLNFLGELRTDAGLDKMRKGVGDDVTRERVKIAVERCAALLSIAIDQQKAMGLLAAIAQVLESGELEAVPRCVSEFLVAQRLAAE